MQGFFDLPMIEKVGYAADEVRSGRDISPLGRRLWASIGETTESGSAARTHPSCPSADVGRQDVPVWSKRCALDPATASAMEG